MKIRPGTFTVALVGALIGLMALIGPAAVDAGSGDYRTLSAEWWKWAYSLPCTDALCPNSVLDQTGDYAVVGQHGEVWFLAGSFGETVTRHAYVPEETQIFFPVINNSFFDSPNNCGQDSNSIGIDEARAAIASSIDGAIKLSATLDGQPLKMFRDQSIVFAVSMPKNNLYEFFGIPCAQGIYSPAVADGYYVLIKKLSAGSHILRIHAENPSLPLVVDVTYHLTVVPLKLK